MDTPAESEATEQPSTIQWRGLTFTVPPSDDWSVEALRAFEDGRAATAVSLVVGKAEWAAFEATRPKIRDFKALADEFARVAGFEDSGE